MCCLEEVHIAHVASLKVDPCTAAFSLVGQVCHHQTETGSREKLPGRDGDSGDCESLAPIMTLELLSTKNWLMMTYVILCKCNILEYS